MTKWNRREFVTRSSAGFALGLVPLAKMFPQIAVLPAQLNTAYDESYAKQFPDMLMSHLVKDLNGLAQKWDGVRNKIKSTGDAEVRSQYVRQKMIEMIGGLPERTPLNPVVTKVLHRDGYRIENVMYQSRPNFWVTANLYVPATGKAPFPGILSPSGHYADAGRSPAYQRAHLDLVTNGFVVLAPDPIGQGERRQFWDTTTKTSVGSTIDEHSTFGQLLWMIGESITQYRVWDGMRSIDYLLARPEVDPSRLGCTGHSGGGFETIWLMACDQRLKCAASIEPGAYHFWPINAAPATNINPGDAEHNWFPAAANGIDACDLFQSFAPRPLLIAVETYANEQLKLAAKHIHAQYELFGAGEKFTTVESTDAHYWTLKLRLATTDWFCRWFYEHPGPAEERDLTIEPVENLFCTPTGSLLDARLGDTLQSIILKKQQTLPPARSVPRSAGELESFRSQLRAELSTLLRYQKVEQPFAVRQVRTTPREGFHIEKLEFLSEPEIYIPAWVFIPQRPVPGARPILYIGDTDTETVGYPESGWAGELAQMGHTVVAVDVRGMGQTRPLHHSYFDNGTWSNFFDVEAAMAYMSWSMDQSLLGMRVQDAIRSFDYALSRADVDRERLAVIGSGMGAIWGLYAAVLDARIQTLIADGGLLSYKMLAQSGRYRVGANLLILDVLHHFDLPQAAAAIADRGVVLISPVSPMKTPVPLADVRLAYQFAQDTSDNIKAQKRFQIVERDAGLGVAQQYRALLA